MVGIDLNVDVGEGYDDTLLLPFVTSVNIACGGHAGDEETMARTLEAALARGLAIGAHPGYEDRDHFGRRELQLEPGEIERLVAGQVARLVSLASRHAARLSHVKPHGALYNQAARDGRLAEAIARAVWGLDPSLTLVGLAGSLLLEAGQAAGLPVVGEAFADRRYLADGSLVPRSRAGAVIDDPGQAARQALAIALGEPVVTIDGGSIRIRAGTLCLHGDSPGAARTARRVREELERAGVLVRPLGAA